VHNGQTITDLERMVRSKYVNTREVPCPQWEDCPNFGQPVRRVFKCPHCDFEGCLDCITPHEAEGHWSDTDTRSAMLAGVR